MKRWKFLATVTVVVAAASLAACGGSDPAGAVSPTSPSSPSEPAAVTGATVSGVVTGLPTSSGAGAVGARGVITVTVAGTTITATVDGGGRFELKGVPAGTVTLTFSGTGATVTIQNVGTSGEINLKITISGGTATVETEQRTTATGETQLEGRISALTPTAGIFYVDSTLVTATSATFRRGDTTVSLADVTLKVGDRIHVTGTAGGTAAAPTIAASLVIVQNVNPKVPVNLKGAISGALVTGCPTAAEFVVEGWKVKADGETDFKKGGCTDLKNGAEVHVKGDVVPAAGAEPAYVRADWIQFGK